jgi:TolB protein
MSRTIRSLTLATLTLAGVTACQNDGPIGPANLPGPRVDRPSAGPATIKLKPTLYFNGILYSGSQDGGAEIYSINPDGSGLYRITNDGVNDTYPDVSPVGPAFAWARFSGDGQTSEIYSENLDGSKRKQLTFLGTVSIHPRYSPDGQHIAFASAVPGAGAEIFTMNSDGTSVARLTTSMRNSQSPSWSPDGSQIAFQSAGANGMPSVWVMYASGGGQHELLTCPPPGCTHPKWSPTANEIAVERLDGSGIYIVDATTGVQTGYVPSAWPELDAMPTWSKDGQKIIFSSTRGGNATYDLYSVVPTRPGMTAPPAPAVRLTSFAPGDEFAAAYSH